MKKVEIIFAEVYGFCFGVSGAIKIAKETLKKYGAPVFVYHKIVHNERVCSDFEKQGVVFIDHIDEITDKSCPLILSAHGSSLALVAEAEAKGIKNVIDAICPLVKQIHEYVRAKISQNYSVIVIGSDPNHDEITGTMGQSDYGMYFIKSSEDIERLPPMDKVCFVSQTTLTAGIVKEFGKAIRIKYPNAETLSEAGVCNATSTRQDAVRKLIKEHNLKNIIVIGSQTSSNTKHLAGVAKNAGAENVYLINSANDIDFDIPERIGITAGASTPQILIDEIVNKINS